MADAIQIKSINDIDTTNISNTKDLLSTVWKSYDSNIDTKSGALDSLVTQPNTLLLQATADNIDIWQKSTNLATLLNTDSTEISAEFLDRIAANYRITRKSGNTSNGKLEIIVSKQLDYSIPANTVFTCNGINYVTQQSYSIKYRNTDVIMTGDQLLVKVQENRWAFYADVISENEISSANVPDNSVFTTTYSIPNLIQISAYGSFIGGSSPETNAELAARVVNGISPPVLSSRNNMSVVLYKTSSLPSVVTDSIVGAGDVEMTRDRHSIFPMSYGGKADWYIRTTQQIRTDIVVKSAVCTEVTNATTVWTLTFNKEEYTGFYSIKSILNTRTGNYTNITSDIRSVTDIPYTNEIVPVIPQANEGLFSGHQTAVITFVDDVTAGNVGDTKDYTIRINYLPDIQTLQKFVSSWDNQMFTGDILVKAPVPCTVSIAFTIVLPDTDFTYDLVAIRDSICNVINTRGFNNLLPKSIIINAIQSKLPIKSYIIDFVMIGSIVIPETAYNDKQVIKVIGDDSISVQDNPLVTQNTVCYFCDSTDISIKIVYV